MKTIDKIEDAISEFSKLYDKASDNTYYFKRSGSSECCNNPTEEFRELTDKEHFYRLDNDMVKIIKETV